MPANTSPLRPNAYGLSINLTDKGLSLKPESFVVADEIFETILDLFGTKLIESQVQRKYKPYCSKAVLLDTTMAMKLTDIQVDQCAPYYDYTDECTEPAAAPRDAFDGRITVKEAFISKLPSMLDVPRSSRVKRKKSSVIHSPGSEMSEKSTSRRFGKNNSSVSPSSKTSGKNIANALQNLDKFKKRLSQGIFNKDIHGGVFFQSEPFKLPEDPAKHALNKEREAMQEKLDNFLQFKRNSKKLARQQQKLYTTNRKSTENVLSLLENHSSDESMELTPGGKVDFLRRQRLKNQRDKDKKGKVTFDFNGQVIKVKAAKIFEDAQQNIVNPEASIKDGASKRRTASRGSSSQVQFREKIVEQFGDELDRIYEERELKLNQTQNSSNKSLEVIQMANRQHSQNSVTAKKEEPTKTVETEPATVNKVVKTIQNNRQSITPASPLRPVLPRNKKISKTLKALHETSADNDHVAQEDFLTGKKSIEDNLKETSHAHIKHENRLFMKDPLQQIKQEDMAGGLSMKTFQSTLIQEGPRFEQTLQSKMTIREYKAMRQQDYASIAAGEAEINILASNNGAVPRKLDNSDVVSTIERKNEQDSIASDGFDNFLTKDKSANHIRDERVYISSLDLGQAMTERPSKFKLGQMHKQSTARKSGIFQNKTKISFAAGTKLNNNLVSTSGFNRKSSLPQISGVTPHSLSLLLTHQDRQGEVTPTRKGSNLLPEVNGAYKPASTTKNAQAWSLQSSNSPNKGSQASLGRGISPLTSYINQSKQIGSMPSGISHIFKSANRPQEQTRRLFKTTTVSQAPAEMQGDYESHFTTMTPAKNHSQLKQNRSSIQSEESFLKTSRHSKFNTQRVNIEPPLKDGATGVGMPQHSARLSAQLSAQLKGRLEKKKQRNRINLTQNAVQLLRAASRIDYGSKEVDGAGMTDQQNKSVSSITSQ